MDIITGYTGTPHITAENDRDINIGIFGSKSYVLQTGTMLTAEISNNNEIKVRDGVIMHQGCAASIKKNTYDSVTINNGSQGMKRIDLLVARYEKQPETNVESLTLKVLQGTPVETSPQVPEHTEGDIQVGDTVADMPLYEVEIDGLNITEIRKVFQTMGDLESVNDKIELQMTPGNGMRFNSQWNDNYAIVNGDILYINFLIENTNATYFKENTPHTLCKIKKPKSVKIGNRLSLAGYALSSSGAARADSGQVSLYTGTSDGEELSVVFLTTDASTYKMNVTGAVLLR